MIPNNADSEYIKTLLKEIAFLKQKNLALEEELDRYKNRNSRNSSTPPSHDFKKNSSKHANLGGAKPGHQVHHRKIIPDVYIEALVFPINTVFPIFLGTFRALQRARQFQVSLGKGTNSSQSFDYGGSIAKGSSRLMSSKENVHIVEET